METVEKNSMKEVDIRNLFHEKNPKLARWIPEFVFRYLRKITRHDFVNEIIRDYGHLQGHDFSAAMMKYFNITIKVEGEEKLPDEGKYIFAANHPLGGLDGHAIMYLVGKKYGRDKYKFLVNDILMNLKNLEDVMMPVNKHGKQGKLLAEKLDATFKSDVHILTFPAGLVSRKIKGQIIDLAWQKSFINKARQYQRDIIPIHMGGENSKFFYRLSKFRNILGIKANIEMLYLINETYKHRNKHISVKFGKPIPWQTFDKSKRPLEWAKWVKDSVYKMDGVENVSI